MNNTNIEIIKFKSGNVKEIKINGNIIRGISKITIDPLVPNEIQLVSLEFDLTLTDISIVVE